MFARSKCRYFEPAGEVRQAISVIKKRGSGHERSIREFQLDKSGIHVGEALRNFRGILTRVPIYEGPTDPPHEQAAGMSDRDTLGL